MVDLDLAIGALRALAAAGQTPTPTPVPVPVPAPTPTPTPPVPAPSPSIPADVRVIDMEFRSNRISPVQMSATDNLAIRFKTGPDNTNPMNLPRIQVAEWGTTATRRIGNLALAPGDFDHAMSLASSVQGNTISIPFSVGPNASGFYPALQPNTTYYLNLKNSPDAVSPCDVFVEIVIPSR